MLKIKTLITVLSLLLVKLTTTHKLSSHMTKEYKMTKNNNNNFIIYSIDKKLKSNNGLKYETIDSLKKKIVEKLRKSRFQI